MAEGLAVVIAAALSWLAGSRIGQWALIALAFAAALFGFHRSAKNAGRAEAESEQAKRTLDNVEKAHEARRDADAANRGGAPDERVRKFYTD